MYILTIMGIMEYLKDNSNQHKRVEGEVIGPTLSDRDMAFNATANL